MNLNIKENSWIAKLAAKKLQSKNVAIAIEGTIHLYNVTKQQFLQNEKWVKHEVCHLQQFKKHGNFIFIFKYLLESIEHGYYNNKYEAEARNAEED
jgi:hypothetical protein